jgi:hypothetical protein
LLNRQSIEKVCNGCGRKFKTGKRNQVRCSRTCDGHPRKTYPKMPSGSFGAAVEMIVSGLLMLDGWNVFRAQSPHCYCDLIAVKGARVRHLEVRTAWREKSGKLTYSKKASPGATEFAVYVPNENALEFVLIEREVTTGKGGN